jgi:hypothetical protein
VELSLLSNRDLAPLAGQRRRIAKKRGQAAA